MGIILDHAAVFRDNSEARSFTVVTRDARLFPEYANSHSGMFALLPHNYQRTIL